MPRADLHVHTCYSMDCLTPLEVLAHRCLNALLDCIAVTDHNTIQGALLLQERAQVEVIIGEEIRTTGGDIIGLFLTEAVPKDLTPLEAVQAVKQQGGLVSVPHPFDRVRSSVITPSALAEVLPHAGMLETFNARNTNPAHDRLAVDLAARHGLPGIAVSDAHTPGEIGHTYMELPDYDGTPQGFLSSLKEATPVCHRSSRFVHLASTYAKVRRRLPGGRPC